MRYCSRAVQWFLVITVLWCCEAAMVSASTYYSIHVASFSRLKNANTFVNSLSAAEKVVFWREVDIAGKGRFYRVFIGRYPSYQSALAVWKKLASEEKVSYQGIFQFESKDLPGETETPIKRAPAPGPEAGAQSVSPGKGDAGERFIDNGDGTITDTEHGLMWVKNGWPLTFFAASQWQEAVDKCRLFSQAGYRDWTLPSVKQWETLIDPGQEAPSLPIPNPFENVIIHMPYWSRTQMVKIPVKAYAVLLYNGRIHQLSKSDRAFIFPVREIPPKQ